MAALLFVLVAAGAYVAWSGATGRSPSAELRAKLTGAPPPPRRPSPLDADVPGPAPGTSTGGGTYTPPGVPVNTGRGQDTPTGCSGKEQPRTRQMWSRIQSEFPAVKFGGIYNCRKIAGGGRWSRHAEGRAVDVMVGHLPDAQRVQVGDAVAAWAVTHADEYGVEELVWNGRSWTTPRRTWQRLSNPRDHWNHVHIGQSRAGSGMTGSQVM